MQLFLSSAEKTINNTQTAKSQLKRASKFLLTNSETARYAQLEKTIISTAANQYFKAKKYKSALTEYATLISFDNADSEIYYQRAYCYYKLGNLKEAVADLTHSKSLGYESAITLYNKVNPLKKRISYYVTRCCDGSTSSAKGRGACSWHGGVCNWNDPVYEEYRKY
ncbi:MAG: tetratricopeptide repeat protein [Chryseobacterium sp.]|nr:MAG: tetratricopeptide repeat protein [Chryseobacterium sp.]